MKADYDCIAYGLHVAGEVIQSVVEDFELFTVDSGRFHSESLLRRMEQRDAKSQKARKAADAKWKKQREAQMQTQSERNADAGNTDANAVQTQEGCNASTEQVQCHKLKENKLKENKEIPPHGAEVELQSSEVEVGLDAAPTAWKEFVTVYPKPFNPMCHRTRSAFHESVKLAGERVVIGAVQLYAEFVEKSNKTADVIPKAQNWLQDQQWRTDWSKQLEKASPQSRKPGNVITASSPNDYAMDLE